MGSRGKNLCDGRLLAVHDVAWDVFAFFKDLNEDVVFCLNFDEVKVIIRRIEKSAILANNTDDVRGRFVSNTKDFG